MLSDTIKVGHLNVKIVHVTKEEAEKEDAWGWFEAETSQIFISMGLSKDVKAEILWHEIIHAIFCAYRLEDRDGDKFSEETIAHVLPCGLLAVMKDNPKLMEWTCGVQQ